MQIRSVTVFVHPGVPLDEAVFRRAGVIAHAVRLVYEAARLPVQTTRLATVPFPLLATQREAAEDLARRAEALAAHHGIDYLALGPALPTHPRAYRWIPALLAATEKTFFSGVMVDMQGQIHPAAVRACAEVIHAAARLEQSGFANLRFAALAYVPPYAPFFPAAYADSQAEQSGVLGFGLALEAADLVVQAFSRAEDVPQAQSRLISAVEREAARLTRLAQDLSVRYEVPFLGVDFSPAPFPEVRTSLGEALERLGVPAVGRHGALAAAAILAEALDRARFPRLGFSGLMLPVLEDAILARRAASGTLTVKDLLLYAAVCGTGLDTVPLPGNTTVDKLEAVLLDLAALAARLRKPLTARLMPIPGKQAGDAVTWDFPYFANCRVLPLDAAPLRGALAAEKAYTLQPRAALREATSTAGE